MTVRYIYLDKDLYNDAHFTGDSFVWKLTFTNLLSSTDMDDAPTTGDSGVVDAVDEGILFPVDTSFWFAQVISSGLAKLPTEPITINPQSLSLSIRNWPESSGMTISDIYVIYKSGLNPTIDYDVILASGYLSPYNFPSQTGWVTTELQLNLNTIQSGLYYNLLSEGIPTLEFEFYNNISGVTYKKISEINLIASGSTFTKTNTLSLFMNVPANYYGALRDEDGEYILAENNNNIFPESLETVPMFIESLDFSSGTMNLYLQVADITLNSDTLPFYLFSTSSSGIFDSIDLTLGSNISPAPEYTLNLSLTGGGILGELSATMNLHMFSGPIPTGTIDLILWNGYINFNDNIPLFLSAPSGTLNAIPDSGIMNLYMGRQYDGVLSNVSLYICGPSGLTENVPLYILCGPSGANSSINMYMSGLGYTTTQIPFFVRGL